MHFSHLFAECLFRNWVTDTKRATNDDNECKKERERVNLPLRNIFVRKYREKKNHKHSAIQEFKSVESLCDQRKIKKKTTETTAKRWNLP